MSSRWLFLALALTACAPAAPPPTPPPAGTATAAVTAPAAPSAAAPEAAAEAGTLRFVVPSQEGSSTPRLVARWTPDGRSIVALRDKLLVVLDARSGKVRWAKDMARHAPLAVPSPDGSMLALANGLENDIALVRTESGEEVRVLSGKKTTSPGIRSLAWNASGTLLASDSEDGAVWEAATGKVKRTVKLGHPVVWSPKGNTLATGTVVAVLPSLPGMPGIPMRCGADLVDIDSGAKRRAFEFPNVATSGCQLDLMFSPDGAWLLGVNGAMTDVVAYEVAAGKVGGQKAPSGIGGIYDIAWSPDGSSLAAIISREPYVQLWRWSKLDVATAPIAPGLSPVSVAWHPSSKLLALGASGGARITRLSDGAGVWLTVVPRQGATPVAAVASEDGFFDGDAEALGLLRFQHEDGKVETAAELPASRRKVGLLGDLAPPPASK